MTTEVRRRTLSLDKKLQIIREAATGKKKSLIAREYGVRPQTICDILYRHAHRLHSVLLEGRVSLHAKRVRQSLFPEVDDALWKWYVQLRQPDEGNSQISPITRIQLYAKANEIAKSLANSSPDMLTRTKYTDVIISQSWIDRWKNRRNILPHDCESTTRRRINHSLTPILPKIEPQSLFIPPLPPVSTSMETFQTHVLTQCSYSSPNTSNMAQHSSVIVDDSTMLVDSHNEQRTTMTYIDNYQTIPNVNDALNALDTIQRFLEHEVQQDNLKLVSSHSLLTSTKDCKAQHYLETLRHLQEDLLTRKEKALRQSRITNYFTKL